MNKLSNEVKIGLIVLAATIVAYIGFRVMKDEPLFSATNVIYTKYENVEGLIRGSNVFLNGFKVGTVKSMSFLPNVDSTLVTISIIEPIKIPDGSQAELVTPGILGSATIKITKSNNPDILEWGGFLQGVRKGGILDTFTDKGESLTDSVTVTIDKLNAVLSKAESINEEDINGTISSFRKTGETIREIIEQRKSAIDSMIVDTRITLGNLRGLSDATKEDLQSIISNLETFTKDLEALSLELESSSKSVSNILAKIDLGEGTLGRMVNDPSLYENLDSLTVNLNELIKGIQEDPKKYLKHMRLVEIF